MLGEVESDRKLGHEKNITIHKSSVPWPYLNEFTASKFTLRQPLLHKKNKQCIAQL